MSTNDSDAGSKKSWDDWTDLEVNKSIAIAKGQKVIQQSMFNIGRVWAIEGWDGGIYKIPDYCNSWADMGPIIANSKIDLTYEGGFRMEWESSHIKHLSEYDVDVIGSNYHVNPLRAAAIVFLEMNGAKPNA